jgi:pyridoxine kinase
MIYCRLLTGLSIRSLEDCIKAINALHDLGVEKVVITSAEFPHSSTNEGSDEPESLVLVGSHRPRDTASSTPPSPPFTIQFPKVPARFTGTGDLFASLILAFESLYGFRNACERATSVMQRVIRRTLEFHNLPLTGNEKRGNMDLETIRQRELRLVQSRDIFMQAPLDYTAQDIAA